MFVLLAISIGLLAAVAMRRNFQARLDGVDNAVRAPEHGNGPRTDLPPEVLALASRLGARGDGAPSCAVLEQTGQMWMTPGGKPMGFTARQTMRTGSPAFLWRAAFAPFGWMLVADYLHGETGGLEVKAFGVVRLARSVGGTDAWRGEALRYLAELPWNPDAILWNRALEWTVVDATTIRVATGVGAVRSEIAFTLDSLGLIVAARADARPYTEKDSRMTLRPWHGKFWDYRRVDGRLVPFQGQVAWVMEAGDFVYWRGAVTRWQA
jgi:hypothetical protein